MEDNMELNQAGFDAIAQKLKQLYPKQDGIFYRSIIPYMLGGNDPLDGVEIWKSETGVPHWHYVTYGYSELYEKECEDPAVSGYGFEMTFRLKCGKEEQPPVWPVNLLQNLARYVFSSGNVVGVGHYIDGNGPIALETDTKLTALGFCMDEELREMDTPNGHVIFLQAIGITSDEMEAFMCWDGKKFLEEMSKYSPFGITDLFRSSYMDNPNFYEAWKQGLEQDGSSTGFLYLDEVGAYLDKGRAYLRLGAGHDQILNRMLRARVGKGRNLYLQGTEDVVQFLPGEPHISMGDGVLSLTMPKEILEEICYVLTSHTGTYPLSDYPLTIELVPTRIVDQDGNVLRTIE